MLYSFLTISAVGLLGVVPVGGIVGRLVVVVGRLVVVVGRLVVVVGLALVG